MIMYHIDRLCSLQKGMVISNIECPKENLDICFMYEKLLNQRLSHNGGYYVEDRCLTDAPRSIESMIEFQLELIRKSFFPTMPSRYHSFFLCDSLDNALYWLFKMSYKKYKLWEIEVDESRTFKFDANMIPPAFKDVEKYVYSPSEIFSMGYRYWNQESTRNPLFEYFTDSPVRVLREVHP